MDNELELALTAFHVMKTPARITRVLREGGTRSLETAYEALPDDERAEVSEKSSDMRHNHIGVIFFGSPDFPRGLLAGDQRPVAPILFYRGNRDLLYRDGVGMCGSRKVSARGLEAASRCGKLAAEKGLTVVSGYAAGVDTATHLAALRGGGSTVLVLAEGMDHFRVKRVFADDFNWEHILVLSQFAPSQPWRAHAAMARNGLIFGIPKALLVIEAGEKGGTLAAGQGALKLGRPVIAVEFGEETPPGNRTLIEMGARGVRTPQQLRAALDEVRSTGPTESSDTLF